MKKFLVLSSILVFTLCTNYVKAEEQQPDKIEQFMTTMSEKADTAAEKTVDSVTTGTKEAGKYIKEKSIIVGQKTAKHAKSGAKKVKNSTVKGANKATNATAKGVKKVAEKMQKSADKTIEKTDKTLEEMTPKCKCKCGCQQKYSDD